MTPETWPPALSQITASCLKNASVADPVGVVAFEEAAIALASRRRPVCAYVYDLAHLRRHARLTRTSLPPGTRLLYAVKANAEPAVLRTLASVVDGFEVASAGEMEKVRAVSATARVAFGGPGKTEAELARALDLGVEVVHVESVNELLRLEEAARRAFRPIDALLRVNVADGLPAATLTMGGPTQFGIDEAQLPEAVDAARRCGAVTLRGFHLHLVSNQLDASAHARLVGRYVDRAMSWAEEHGVALSMMNAGGGFGVAYAQPVRLFDIRLFGAQLHEELARRPASAGLTLVFESGRFLVASAGAYLAEVLDLKINHGRHFAVVRGGTHHFRLPASWGHSHPFRVVPTGDSGRCQSEISDCLVTVVGQLCTPKDVLARNVPVRRLRIGDVLVFHHAGAYGWSISHHDFLSHPHPEVVLLDEEQVSGSAGTSASRLGRARWSDVK